ncbi:TRIM28 [Mytilus coruscus]|uniref:TRIM28 n=1 Tax=Mytilus coruscus TaxID=42192 RepID=A0A6J8BCA5_MYTCO|nr:TRIM28 [Mytilus coruscus]
MAQFASNTCEMFVGASGSQYCLECEQYFCENCKTFHIRQKLSKSKNHQFQSSSDVIPESKWNCKDHNEDVSFVCITCNIVVYSICVTGNHKDHEFSKLIDSITQLKKKNTNDLRRKEQEATQNMKIMEEGIKSFDRKVEVVDRAITEKGTQIKAMVDKCIAQMTASVKDQSKKEKEKKRKNHGR